MFDEVTSHFTKQIQKKIIVEKFQSSRKVAEQKVFGFSTSIREIFIAYWHTLYSPFHVEYKSNADQHNFLNEQCESYQTVHYITNGLICFLHLLIHRWNLWTYTGKEVIQYDLFFLEGWYDNCCICFLDCSCVYIIFCTFFTSRQKKRLKEKSEKKLFGQFRRSNEWDTRNSRSFIKTNTGSSYAIILARWLKTQKTTLTAQQNLQRT